MKKLVLFLCCLTLSYVMVFLNSCKDDNDADVTPEKMTFAVISDLHYFDQSLFDKQSNQAFNAYLAADRKLIRESSVIFESVINNILEQSPDFVLVPGDLTKDGELINHQAVAKSFDKLISAGIKVLVVPGNHDVNNPDAYSFLNGTSAKLQTVTSTEFASIYGNCGYASAIYRDANSLSYVSEPVNGVWIIAIDACQYDQNTTNGSPVTAGQIATDTYSWINSMLSLAKSKNKIVMSMMHHGLVEHFPGQSTMFSEYLIDDWSKKSKALADSGLSVVFTGHYHANDIVKATGTGSNFIFDIETGSTVTYPCPYRLAELNRVTKTLQVVTRRIQDVSYSTIPNGVTFQNYAKGYVTDGIKLIANYMLTSAPYSIPASYVTAYKMDSIMANAFVAHYAGDETALSSDLSDVEKIKTIVPALGSAIGAVWNDPAPADNTITINLTNGEVAQ